MTDQLTGQSPFALHRTKLQGDHGSATRLKRIVLNLYNGNSWPILHDELAGYLSNADQEHRDALVAMLTWYAQHGENDPDFMQLGRELADQALRAHDWRTGYDDAYAGRNRRNNAYITNGNISEYLDGYTAGQNDRSQQ